MSSSAILLLRIFITIYHRKKSPTGENACPASRYERKRYAGKRYYVDRAQNVERHLRPEYHGRRNGAAAAAVMR